MLKRTQKIFLSPIVYDFLKKLFVLFVVLYIIIFGIEAIFLGTVMNIFNINTSLLLLLIIIDLFLLRAFSPRQNEISIVQAEQVLKNPLIFSIIIIMKY